MENAAASEQPAPEPALTDAEVITLKHEGQQSSPSLSQAQKMRELDKDGKLNGNVSKGTLSQEKKKVSKRQMTISPLLEKWSIFVLDFVPIEDV